MRMWWRMALAALALVVPALAHAASETPKPLFAGADMIRLSIKAPLSTIIAKRIHSDDPVDGTLTVLGSAPETLPIKLAVRGLTRRKGDICEFPPLRVEFAQKPPPTSLFAGQKKLKLVTHCKNSASYQQHVLVEYSAYKLYNVLTPVSYDARLATVDYVDADGRLIASRFGFFLEDTADVAKRNGLREAELGDKTPIATLNSRAAARAAIFEYMIGNLDWAMNAGPPGAGCCHNFKLLGEKGATAGFIPMPYDYDFSGLVDAPYAAPPDEVQVDSVRTRRYRGFCANNADAQAAAADFRANRAAMLAIYGAIPQMEDGPRRKALAYLNGFFDQISSEAEVSAKLLRTCL